MAEVAWLLRRHLPNVLTYLRHRITNAGLEAMNAMIQWVKRTARGFRNAEHFKTAIYFHCGDWISTHTKAGRAEKQGDNPRRGSPPLLTGRRGDCSPHPTPTHPGGTMWIEDVGYLIALIPSLLANACHSSSAREPVFRPIPPLRDQNLVDRLIAGPGPWNVRSSRLERPAYLPVSVIGFCLRTGASAASTSGFWISSTPLRRTGITYSNRRLTLRRDSHRGTPGTP